MSFSRLTAARLEDFSESPEQETGKHHSDGQGENPGHHQVANGCPLQAGMIGGHGTGDTLRQHVSGTDGQTEGVRGANGSHGSDFRGGALRVSEMILAVFFADRDDDALPADHGAQSERNGDRHFDPQRDEASGAELYETGVITR